MSNFHLLFLLIAFLFFMTIFYLVLSLFIRRIRFKNRLNTYDLLAKKVDDHLENEEKQNKEKLFIHQIKMIGKLFDRFSQKSKWSKLLIQANSELSTGEFLFFRLLSLAVFVLAGYLLDLYPLFLIPIGILGYWVPVFHLKKKLEKRINRCSHQLAEALGTMANSMRAGFSFMQAMKLISEEFDEPIGSEFEKTLVDINYGIPVEEAFLRLLDRLPDRELEMAVKAMLIQRASGGNLAVLLETIQETVIGRIQIKDEVRTLTAQGKLSSWIITGLPVFIAIYLKVVNPSFTNLMYEHPLGIIMLSVGAIGIIIGWVFIRKIIRIEV